MVTSCPALEISQLVLATEPKQAYCIHPLEDPRWDRLVQRHPHASVFHSSRWLQALARTYGYEPVAYTTSAPGEELENGIPFCRVDSWLTGRRMVSLPFSDHCEPLVETQPALNLLMAALEKESERDHLRYLELRPLETMKVSTPLRRTEVSYTFHQLDLSSDLDSLFRNLHKSSTQRKVRRAEREGLICREGTSDALLDVFYGLLTVTRKRHMLPPQPRQWFINLIECFGEALKIRVVFKGEQAIAAMLTIRHKDTLMYKYGACDTSFNNLGSMHLLFWTAIQEAKAAGLRTFDLGRSDAEQEGLITFKSRWGARQSALTYSRFSTLENSRHVFDLQPEKWKSRAAKFVLARLPLSVLSTLSPVLYRHVG
jgi:CelD/BcsL family acetyltransferase involved in cellulose biosynthesis